MCRIGCLLGLGGFWGNAKEGEWCLINVEVEGDILGNEELEGESAAAGDGVETGEVFFPVSGGEEG